MSTKKLKHPPIFTKWGEAILHTPTQKVPEKLIKTKEFQEIIDKMINLIKGKAFGLAANQINLPISLAVASIFYKTEKGIETILEPIEIINPEILEHSKELIYGWETCLSCPGGTTFFIPRYNSIKVSYLDRNGKKITKKYDGIKAIVLQHEIDHLHGRVCGERVLVVNGEVPKGAIISREEYENNPWQIPEGARHFIKVDQFS